MKLWHGVVKSSENSQHLTDWYTFRTSSTASAFYWLLRLFARRLPLGSRFVIAAPFEAAWEVFENTPFVIERYRDGTIALDYYGDSVVNSVTDIVAMLLGLLHRSTSARCGRAWCLWPRSKIVVASK